MNVYIQYENLNERFPVALFGSDGEVKARFADEISAEQWATRNRYIIGLLSVGRG